MDAEEIRELFTYHPPTSNTIPKFQAIKDAAIAFAIVIDSLCPPCADRSAAVRLVQQARMTANSAIANDGKSYR